MIGTFAPKTGRRSRTNAKFLQFDGEEEARQNGFGNVDAKELHQRPDGGGDDGAGSGQSDLARNAGIIANRKVFGSKADLALLAIFGEAFDGCFDLFNTI